MYREVYDLLLSNNFITRLLKTLIYQYSIDKVSTKEIPNELECIRFI